MININSVMITKKYRKKSKTLRKRKRKRTKQIGGNTNPKIILKGFDNSSSSSNMLRLDNLATKIGLTYDEALNLFIEASYRFQRSQGSQGSPGSPGSNNAANSILGGDPLRAFTLSTKKSVDPKSQAVDVFKSLEQGFKTKSEYNSTISELQKKNGKDKQNVYVNPSYEKEVRNFLIKQRDNVKTKPKQKISNRIKEYQQNVEEYKKRFNIKNMPKLTSDSANNYIDKMAIEILKKTEDNLQKRLEIYRLISRNNKTNTNKTNITKIQKLSKTNLKQKLTKYVTKTTKKTKYSQVANVTRIRDIISQIPKNKNKSGQPKRTSSKNFLMAAEQQEVNSTKAAAVLIKKLVDRRVALNSMNPKKKNMLQELKKRKEAEKEAAAATKIQALFRGHQVRKTGPIKRGRP